MVILTLVSVLLILHDRVNQWYAIVLIGLISIVYMAFYFHIALRWFGDHRSLQALNVLITIIILGALQHFSRLTAEIALLYMLVVSISGLRMGLAASLVAAVLSALGSLLLLTGQRSRSKRRR